MSTFGADPFVVALATLSGAVETRSPYTLLREWISKQDASARVLAVVPDRHPGSGGLWLRVMFERRRDVEKFEANGHSALESIASEFRRIVAQERSRIEARSIHISLHAFDEEYQRRAALLLSEADKADLLSKCDTDLIWQIRVAYHGEIVFFFHTDEQLVSDAAAAVRKRCQSALDEIIARNDRFDYLGGASYPLRFDSRERFKRVFNESWFNYDR